MLCQKIENLFCIIFRTFRVEKLKNLDDMHIVSALVELNDRSNISGTSGDRDFDETGCPQGTGTWSSATQRRPARRRWECF